MRFTLINFIYHLSLVCWIGGIIFFSFFVVPLVFKTPWPEKAGTVVGIFTPRYYINGYVCGILVLVALLPSEPAAF